MNSTDEESDVDVVYLGTGPNRDLLFADYRINSDDYVRVGTDETRGTGHRDIVMTVDRAGRGIYDALQSTMR